MTYSKYRRMQHGLLWETDEPPPLQWRPILEVMAGIAVLFGLYGWTQYRDTVHALQDQEALTMLVAGNLAACMNGGAVLDLATDTAHFCEKVVSVKLGVKNLPKSY